MPFSFAGTLGSAPDSGNGRASRPYAWRPTGYEIVIHRRLACRQRVARRCRQDHPDGHRAVIAGARQGCVDLAYIWPEDDLNMKRDKRSPFPLIVALVMCITFTVVFLLR
jgi:hypothetical protein